MILRRSSKSNIVEINDEFVKPSVSINYSGMIIKGMVYFYEFSF